MHNFTFSSDAAFPASFEKRGKTVRARFPNKRGGGKNKACLLLRPRPQCMPVARPGEKEKEERCIATCEVKKKLCLNKLP